jgi:transposase InsO family protein
MRALLVERVRVHHWSVAAAATAAGVSPRSTYKWLARYRVGGAAALQDRSSRPSRQARATPPDVIAAILAARRARLTSWAIAVRLQVPRSTVAAIVARHGLNRLARLTPPAPVCRYERTRPGELVHLDIKPLGRIGGRGRRFATGRSVGAGWEYLHVAIDDYSRAAYAEVLREQTATATIGFFRRTQRWFARRGVRMECVLTDNGGAYVSQRFRQAAAAAGVGLRRTRPYRPQTNGKAERLIQTLLAGWAYCQPYPSSDVRTRALQPWLQYYNLERPHTALGYRPPCARFPRLTQ